MPILEVEVVLRPGEILGDQMSANIADRAATALHARPGGTWVKLRMLGPDRYAEDAGGPPAGVYPVFVKVLKADVPAPEELEAEIVRLTRAIAAACDRPSENVHILYDAPARGRIAFGGHLV